MFSGLLTELLQSKNFDFEKFLEIETSESSVISESVNGSIYYKNTFNRVIVSIVRYAGNSLLRDTRKYSALVELSVSDLVTEEECESTHRLVIVFCDDKTFSTAFGEDACSIVEKGERVYINSCKLLKETTDDERYLRKACELAFY